MVPHRCRNLLLLPVGSVSGIGLCRWNADAPMNIKSPLCNIKLNRTVGVLGVSGDICAGRRAEMRAAMECIFQQKRALRSRMRRELKNLDPNRRKEEDVTIQNLVLEAPWFKSSHQLCTYISCEALREVDTSKIVSEVMQKYDSACNMQIPKRLYVPRVEDKKSHMRMLHITSIGDLVANSMNILEPTLLDSAGNQREDVMQADEPLDLLILPGLAFDRLGRRLGRGGGYYDLFLKNYLELAGRKGWHPPLLVALSYSIQVLDEAIPVSGDDVTVDALVTPSGLISVSLNALRRM